VVLDLDNTNYAVFKPYEAQLPALFLVSQVRLSGDFAGETGISVGALPAEGVKCARCWLIKTDVGIDAGYPDLCGRCAGVLTG
jgi:isoleucyl-tRNA synthetase